MLIADTLAGHVDTYFASGAQLRESLFLQPDAWIAGYLFAFQIYFDFSGYVDMALGLGLMLGINLRENFGTPYLSRSPREFWTRWHITLSTWFRDYLYIPLGGNRRGRGSELANLIIVMTVVGLWHGAGWTFITWGAIHGIYLGVAGFVPTRQSQALLPVPIRYRAPIYNGIAVFVFFHLTVLAWMAFRAPDLTTAIFMWVQAFRFGDPGAWIDRGDILAVVAALFVMHVVERLVRERPRLWKSVPGALRGVAYATAFLLVVIQVGTGVQESFVYFRF